MMDGMGLGNLNALADLLRPPNEDPDSDEDDKPKTAMAKMGPGDISQSKRTASNKTTETTNASSSKDSKDIWDENEIKEGQEYEDIYDTRPSPEHEIIYSQAVTSEDMFLQMGNKTPATSSCENMIVKITLPDTDIKDVKLDVKPKFLDCCTPTMRLALHLPHPVDSSNGKAEWNKNKSVLSVTLAVKRDYDFMNF